MVGVGRAVRPGIIPRQVSARLLIVMAMDEPFAFPNLKASGHMREDVQPMRSGNGSMSCTARMLSPWS